MRQQYFNLVRWFNSLPKPVRSLFWTILGVELAILNSQISVLHTGNAYIDGALPAIVVFGSWAINEISKENAKLNGQKKLPLDKTVG